MTLGRKIKEFKIPKDFLVPVTRGICDQRQSHATHQKSAHLSRAQHPRHNKNKHKYRTLDSIKNKDIDTSKTKLHIHALWREKNVNKEDNSPNQGSLKTEV